MDKKISFLEFERRILVNLVEKHRDIIDSKKTDARTVDDKRQIWLRITNEFNGHANVRKRLTKQLKRLWDNTKHRSKQRPVKLIKKQNNINSPCNDSHQSFITREADEHIIDRSNSQNSNIIDNTTTETDGIDVSGFDEIFHQNVVNEDIIIEEVENPHHHQHQIVATKTDAIQNNDNNDQHEQLLQENYLEADYDDEVGQYLSPIVTCRVRKLEESREHQKELHDFAIQREQMQIRLLQEEANHKNELHAWQMEREREIYDLRIRLEKEAHSQRMRNEQELHQIKCAEYNKNQSTYPLLYK